MYQELDRAKSEGFCEAFDFIKQGNHVLVPKNIIESILHYCEDQAICDKLSEYSDFYYKLKNI